MTKTVRTTIWLVVVGIAAVAAASADAQSSTAAQNQNATARQEVFCEGMSAGQLCPTGSGAVLRLEGAKKERWLAAANKYNQAVDAATKAFLADAKTTLSPQEFAQVEKWFDKNLNVLMNQQLLSGAR